MIAKEKVLNMLDEDMNNLKLLNMENLDILKDYYSDFDVMLKAIQIDGRSILYASYELRQNPEIVITALLNTHGNSSYEKIWEYIGHDLYCKLTRKKDLGEFSKIDLEMALDEFIKERKIEAIQKEKQKLESIILKKNVSLKIYKL